MTSTVFALFPSHLAGVANGAETRRRTLARQGGKETALNHAGRSWAASPVPLWTLRTPRYIEESLRFRAQLCRIGTGGHRPGLENTAVHDC